MRKEGAGVPGAAPTVGEMGALSLLSPEEELGHPGGRNVNGTLWEAGGFYSGSFLSQEGRQRGCWRFEERGKH